MKTEPLRAASATTLRLGTRESPLALAQSRQVAVALEQLHPGLTVDLVGMTTRGDREMGDLKELGGKGLFTEELEQGLAAGSLDLAVHSLKDLPVNLPDNLTIAAYPRRADPRDALISAIASNLDELPPGAVLLTGSQRRRAQLLHDRDDLEIQPVRGNVGTRIRKWREGGHAGVILATAGLVRLDVDDLPVHPLDPERMIPAPGQGILALQVRRGSPAERWCRTLDHPASARAADAERRIVRAFGGDCTLPLAAWAQEDAEGMRLTAMLATPDGRLVCRGTARADDPASVAAACLEAMQRDGAASVIAELRR